MFSLKKKKSNKFFCPNLFKSREMGKYGYKYQYFSSYNFNKKFI